MAISGKFEADFAAFYTAVQTAEVHLQSFEGNASKVGAALDKATNSFSGTTIIQQATIATEAVTRVGGATTLTATEQARVNALVTEAITKYKALGQDVPPQLQAMADATKGIGTAGDGVRSVLTNLEAELFAVFSVGGVIAFGHEVLTAGSSIQKMAEQTGLSTTEVQKFKYVAEQSDTAIESLIGAAQNLQVRLGDDTTGAAGAMAKLGINSDEFIKLPIYQQMTSVAEAIRALPNPVDQASVSAALFGKTWKEILPAIKSGMVEVGDQAPIMAESTVKSLKRVDDTLKEAHAQATAWGGGFVLALEGAGNAVGQFLSIFNPEHFGKSTDEVLQKLNQLNDPTGFLGALGKIPPLAKQADDSLKGVALSTQQLRDLNKDLERSAERSMEANKAAAEALAKAQAEADSIALNSYQKRVQSLELVTQATLKAYSFDGQISQLKALEQAEEDLARSVYGQITSEKDRAKIIEDIATRRIAIETQLSAVEVKHAGLVNAQLVAEFEARRQLEAAVGRNVDGTTGEINAYEKMILALKNLHDKKQEGISQYNQEQVIIKQYTDLLLAEALADDALIAATNQHAQAERDRAAAIEAAAAAAYKGRQDLANYAAAAVPTSASLTKAGIIASTQSVSGFAIPLPSHADGGPVSEGPAYLHDNEYVVPAGGALAIRGGSSQPVSITTNLVVDGRVLTTIVNTHNMQSLRNQVRSVSGA